MTTLVPWEIVRWREKGLREAYCWGYSRGKGDILLPLNSKISTSALLWGVCNTDMSGNKSEINVVPVFWKDS